MSVEMPRVYDTETGGYTRRLHPISCAVYQSLAPLSTANIELPSMEEIKPFDWVQIFTPDGKSEYYRVASVTTNAVTGDQSVYLEHGACTLGDVLIPDIAVDAQTTSTSSHGANLKEYPENKTDTIRNILTYILGKQSSPARWSVGTVEATDTIYIELGGFSLLSSISSMMQYIPDYQLEFVQTENAWTVNIKHRPTTVLCEGRLSRNLASCDISYNTANIITRVYSDGVSGGHIDSSNVSVYGLHEETMTMSESLSEAQKVAIIQAYLRNHDHPTVSVTISGVELSQITGLEIDAFKVGAVCRIAIPWLSINEEQVIIDKNYSDCYNFPEEVTITLANATPDLVIAMAAITSTVSGGGGGIGGGLKAEQAQEEKEKKRYETRMEKTDEYFRFLATDTQWDEMGQGTLTAYAQLVVTSESIQSVVTDIQNSGYSSITQLADSISLIVDDDGVVTPAKLILAINDNEESTATLSADQIDIDGIVTALEVKDLSVGNFHAEGQISTLQDIYAEDAIHTDETLSAAKGVYGEDFLIGVVGGTTTSVKSNAISGIGTATSSGGTISIPTTTLDGSAGPSINFNIADTAYYQSHIGINSTGSWLWDTDSEVYYRTITPNDGQDVDINLPTITATAGNFANHKSTVTVSGPGNHAITTTVVDATNEYTNGVTEGESHFTSAGRVYTRGTSAHYFGSAGTIYEAVGHIYLKLHPASETPTGSWYSTQSSSSGATLTLYTRSSRTDLYVSGSGTPYYTSTGFSDNYYTYTG